MWMLSLCGATAITSLFRILLSNSSLKKVLNIFFTLFVLFYTITPVKSVFNNYKIIKPSFDTPTDYNEIYKNGYEQIIKLSIDNECEKSGVELLACNVNSYMSDEGYLCVESIEISIDNISQNNLIKSKIKENLGYEVIIK